MQKYFDLFNNLNDVHTAWSGSGDVKEEELLLAIYSYDCYSGYAYLLYERDGKLYEVYDSHCSCCGLDQWGPEETTWAALRNANKKAYGTDFNDRFQSLVKAQGE